MTREQMILEIKNKNPFAKSMSFMKDTEIEKLYWELVDASDSSTKTIKLISKGATRTSKGIVSKGWYSIERKPFLVKGNTTDHYEPLAEFIGSRIAHYMTNGFAILYDIQDSKDFPEVKTYGIGYVSVCPKWQYDNTMQFSKYVDALEGKEIKDYRMWIINKASMELVNQICVMLLVDAVIGNQDRHLNNWDIDPESGLMVKLIDFGASCLAWNTKDLVTISKNNSITPDVSKPFARTHLEQLKIIKSFSKKLGKKVNIKDPLCAVEESIKEADIIGRFNPIYLEAVYNYLKRRVLRIIGETSDFVEIKN